MGNGRIAIALVIAGFTFGCATLGQFTPRSGIFISDEERFYEPVKSKSYLFENSEISISFIPDIADAGVSFSFKNKTSKVLKIIWDETIYLSPSGQSERVIHSGVRLMDRNASQPPTILPPQGTHSDDLVPTSHVDFVPGQYGGWTYKPLCGEKELWTSRLKDESCIGTTHGFFITYEIDSTKRNATLHFKYKGKKVTPKKTNQQATSE